MKRIAMAGNWSRKAGQKDTQPALRKYSRYLEDRMLASSTIESYLYRVKLFLWWAGTDTPSTSHFDDHREVLRKKNTISSYNNCCLAIKHYYAMNGQDVTFKLVKPQNTIPYWFDETDILKIFSVVRNIKHYAMLQVAFFASLRASGVCDDYEDIDLQNLSIRIKCGKGRKPALLYINDECARSLRNYIEVRPDIVIDNIQPLYSSINIMMNVLIQICGRWVCEATIPGSDRSRRPAGRRISPSCNQSAIYT
jgi:site-specific recombinase XerD